MNREPTAAPSVQKMRLGDLLVESGLINQEQLNSALQIQKSSGGKKLGAILVDLDIITEEQVLTVLQKKLGAPLVNLDAAQISDTMLEAVPEDFASSHIVFPYKMQGNQLYIATSDPLDYETITQLGGITGRSIEVVLAPKNAIINAIGKHYRRRNVDEMANILNTTAQAPSDQLENIDLTEIENRVGEVPVVKFINNLILQAYNRRASDIHIEPGEDSLRVRFRVDGELIQVVSLSMKTHASIVTRVKIMSEMDIAERRLPLDGRFTINLEGSDLNVRAASMPTIYGEKLVLRLMADSKSGILALEQLGISSEIATKLRASMHNPNGLILITGPTGSGKSTTLYSMLNEMSTISSNIVTVEDPVEKIVPGVNQTQTNNKAGLTFAAGLRAILRQDPDRIMIGEIRDLETADIAARAAITGHLVLASMHTNSAAAAYMRLGDMGVEPYVIASSLICVMAQRLIKMICPHCKEEYNMTYADENFYRRLGKAPPEKLYVGKGCPKCDYTGSLGRTAINEIIMSDAKIRQMIIDKAKSGDIEDYLVKEHGQKFLLDGALQLVQEGKIFIREILNIIQTTD